MFRFLTTNNIRIETKGKSRYINIKTSLSWINGYDIIVKC